MRGKCGSLSFIFLKMSPENIGKVVDKVLAQSEIRLSARGKLGASRAIHYHLAMQRGNSPQDMARIYHGHQSNNHVTVRYGYTTMLEYVSKNQIDLVKMLEELS
jgi:hypothetical protein